MRSLLAATLCALLPALLHAADPAPSIGPVPAPADAEISLTAEKTTIIAGEPLVATLSLKNKSAAPFPASGVHYTFVFMKAVDPSGHAFTDLPKNIDEGRSRAPVNPGAIFEMPKLLSHFMTFDRPGEYTIAGICEFGFQTRYIEEVSLEIYHPASARTFLKITVLPADNAKLGAIIDDIGKTMLSDTTTPEARLQTVDKLCDLTDPRRIPWLIKAAGRDDRTARTAMQALATPDASDEALALFKQRATPSQRTEIRTQAVWCLAQSTRPAAAAALLTFIDDPDPQVRLLTWRTLKQSGRLTPRQDNAFLLALTADKSIPIDMQLDVAREYMRVYHEKQTRPPDALIPLVKKLINSTEYPESHEAELYLLELSPHSKK